MHKQGVETGDRNERQSVQLFAIPLRVFFANSENNNPAPLSIQPPARRDQTRQ